MLVSWPLKWGDFEVHGPKIILESCQVTEAWASKVKIKWTSRESQCDNETAFVDYLFYLISYFFLIKSLSTIISQVLSKLYVPNKYFQNQQLNKTLY